MANFPHRSPGILSSIERFRCTTSSWEKGRTKFSWKAYSRAKVSWPKWYFRWIGSFSMKESMSCIHPMFHFRVNPSPPRYVGRDTAGQAVDSSATVIAPGCRSWTSSFIRLRKAIASRFSFPPWTFGTHSPGFRE